VAHRRPRRVISFLVRIRGFTCIKNLAAFNQVKAARQRRCYKIIDFKSFSETSEFTIQKIYLKTWKQKCHSYIY
jgi:hypothetical protein